MGCESNRESHQLHSKESLNGSTPYDAALETLGKETLNAFQLKRIDPDLVNLTPKLIRFNH